MSDETGQHAAGYILGLLGVTVFAATLPMTRIALQAFSPGFIACGRAAIAAAVAGAVLVVLRRRLPPDSWREILVAGTMLVFGFPLCSSLAMQTVPASHGAVVLGILPLLTAVFAALIAGERPGLSFWGWSLLGAAIVLAFTLSGADAVPGAGDLWLGLAALSAALGYVVSGRLSRRVPGWEVIAWALVLTAPLSWAGTWWFSDASAQPGAAETMALVYLALGSMFGGFVFWNAGLALGGIARVGQVQLLQTFITLGFSAVLLHERITPATVGFAAAVALVVWMGRKARVG